MISYDPGSKPLGSDLGSRSRDQPPCLTIMSFSWMLPFIRFCRNDIAPCALALSIKTRRSYKLASSDLWPIVIALLEPLCSPLLTVYCNIDCTLYRKSVVCDKWQRYCVFVFADVAGNGPHGAEEEQGGSRHHGHGRHGRRSKSRQVCRR